MGAWVKNGNIRGPQGGTFPDAPTDGTIYARQSAAWVPTVPEAPNDTYPYVRMQGTWIPGVWAAPVDGKTYAQKDAVWTEINVDTGTIGNLPVARVTGAAPLASPVFTGNPTGPTPATADSSGSLATTSFVKAQGYTTAATVTSMLSTYAPLFSPVFTGNPTAPTPATADNDTSVATTAFVKAQGYATTAALGSYLPLAGGVLTGTLGIGGGVIYGRGGAAQVGLQILARTQAETGGPVVNFFTGNYTSLPYGIAFYTGTGTLLAMTIDQDQHAYFYGNGNVYGGAVYGAGATATTGLGLWAKRSTDASGSGHIGLRASGYVNNPNGIDFYTGGTGTAGFSAALQIYADARAKFYGTIETAGGAEVRSSGSLVSSGPTYVKAASGGNAQVIFMSDASATLGLVYQSPSNGVLVLDNRFASTNQLLQLGTTGNLNLVGSTANLTIAGSVATKATGTTWANPSDARIKNVLGNYAPGLAEVRQLQPRSYTYKANYTPTEPGVDPYDPTIPKEEGLTAPYEASPHYQMAIAGTEIVGFVAQEIGAVFPEMVTLSDGWIDGVEVHDFRTLDTSNLTYALVNAIKELADRVEALEAA